MLEAVRKVPLGRSLDLLRCLFPDEFGFYPRSWFLPQQFVEFSDAVRQTTTTSTTTTTVTTEPAASRMVRKVAQRRDQQQQLQLQQQQLLVIQPSKPSNHSVFIVKPDEGSQGEGIYLIQVIYLYRYLAPVYAFLTECIIKRYRRLMKIGLYVMKAAARSDILF